MSNTALLEPVHPVPVPVEKPLADKKTFVVLFVVPDVRTDVHVHLGSIFEGVAYISTYLKNAGYSVEIFQPKSVEEGLKLEERIRETNPSLIGMSATSCTYKYVREYSDRIKAMWPDMPIICGGIHAVLAPEEVIAHPTIDIIADCEGEELMVEVADRLFEGKDMHGVCGAWFKEDGKVIKNPKRDLPVMDGMPFPDLELFNVKTSFYHKNRFGTLKLSRGCPYLCTYCVNPNLLGTLKDRKKFTRLRSPENAIEHIKEYLEKYPYIDTLAFLDDIIFLNPAWFNEFAKMYKEQIGLPFAARGRCNLFGEETAKALADAGCYEITFGVEAGDDHIRNNVLYRKMSKETMVEAFQRAKKYGITTRANNMIGSPYETIDAIFETIILNSKFDHKAALNSVFFPFRGSPLYDLCRKEGFLSTEEVNDSPFNNESMLDYPDLSKRQILYFRLWFDVLVVIVKRFPGLTKPLIRLHHLKHFPFNAMISIYRIWQRFEKLSFNIKMKLGIRIKRYEANKKTGQVEKVALAET